MNSILPIGVVIPTLNCVGALPRHLAALRTWLDRVEEVVVVDSHSTDGTCEYLQANLAHPRARFFQRPKGLYQAWNYGISEVKAEYTHISTMGDTITGAGLEELARVLDGTGADVVVSQPEFYDEHDQRLDGRPWPIHRLLAECPVDVARVLEPWQAFLLSVIDIPEGLMGSSASNLYRTATLQRFPFPTEYGHAGDSAWGIGHSLETRMALSTGVFSRFVIHENANTGMQADTFRGLVDRFYALAQEMAVKAAADAGMVRASQHLPERLCALLTDRHRLWQLQLDYEAARREFAPWFLSQKVWRARAARNRSRAALRLSVRQLVAGLGWHQPAQAHGDFEAAFRGYLARRILEIC